MFGLNPPSTDFDATSFAPERPLAPAPVPDPCAFIQDHLHFAYTKQEPSDHVRMAAYHGTTTLAFIYNGGIVCAADSRATGGALIFSGTVLKIIQLAPNMVGTIAGGAADCQYWLRNLSKIVQLHKFRYQQPITVAAASKILTNMLYEYKGYDLSIGTIISGIDTTGPHLFYVDNDGTRISGTKFSVGSGSMHALGVLDTGWRADMTKDEACDLARAAIYEATFRDSGSGGRVTVCHITEAGVEWVSRTDVNDLHDFGRDFQ
jgi:20S proteasome subunit beta 5